VSKRKKGKSKRKARSDIQTKRNPRNKHNWEARVEREVRRLSYIAYYKVKGK
jgi:hypothetical protein